MLRKGREGKTEDRAWCWTQGRAAAEREEVIIFGPVISNGHRPVWAFPGEKNLIAEEKKM